jgi:hypothetical protein
MSDRRSRRGYNGLRYTGEEQTENSRSRIWRTIMTPTTVMVWWLCLAASPQCKQDEGFGAGQLEQQETVVKCENEWKLMLMENPAPEGYVARHKCEAGSQDL